MGNESSSTEIEANLIVDDLFTTGFVKKTINPFNQEIPGIQTQEIQPPLLRKQQKPKHTLQTSTQRRINRMTTVDFDEMYNDIQKEIEEDLKIINSAINEEKQNEISAQKKTPKIYSTFDQKYNNNSNSTSYVYEQKQNTKSSVIKPLISPTISKNKKPIKKTANPPPSYISAISQKTANLPPSYISAISQKIEQYPPPTHMKHINKIFSYKKQLGKGASSRVLLCTHRKNRKLYALKELTRKEKHNYYSFLKEISMLRTLEGCPTIINIFDCYTDEECYYIAMDYCTGGTMLDTLIAAQTLSERVVADYLKILLEAIAYMHDRNIVHRDIKLNNLMLSEPPPFGKLRIIDFGDSDTIEKYQAYNLWVGTMHYLPPETIRTRYGWEMKKGDMWAIGILTFVLVSGKIPFYGKTQKRILNRIQKGEYFWPKNMDPSNSCQNFVSQLLCLDTKKRLSARQALKHEWIVSKASEVEFPPESLKRLRSLSYNNKLQRILVNAIFNEINEYEKDILMDGIKELDINNTGYVDANDIVTYLLTHSNQVQMTQSFATKQAEHIIQSVQPSLSRSSSRRSNGKISVAISIKDDLPIIDSLLERTILSAGSSAMNSPTPLFVSVKDDVDGDEDYDYYGDDDDGPVISVDSFCAIMKRSKKQYSINSLVSDLDPEGTGVIPITKIAMYGGSMRTISIGYEELREDLPVDSGQDVKLLSDFEI